MPDNAEMLDKLPRDGAGKPMFTIMSHPQMDGDRAFVSLVPAGANRRTVTAKSDTSAPVIFAPGVKLAWYQRMVSPAEWFGGGQVGESFLAGATKSVDATTFDAQMAVNTLNNGLWRSTDTLQDVIRNILEDESTQDKVAAVEAALTQFHRHVMAIVSPLATATKDATVRKALASAAKKALTMDAASIVACCQACIAACQACISACMTNANVADMGACIRACQECVDICSLCVALCNRNSAFAPMACAMCEMACRACANACAASDMEFCKVCASTCLTCATMCAASRSAAATVMSSEGAIKAGKTISKATRAKLDEAKSKGAEMKTGLEMVLSLLDELLAVDGTSSSSEDESIGGETATGADKGKCSPAAKSDNQTPSASEGSNMAKQPMSPEQAVQYSQAAAKGAIEVLKTLNPKATDAELAAKGLEVYQSTMKAAVQGEPQPSMLQDALAGQLSGQNLNGTPPDLLGMFQRGLIGALDTNTIVPALKAAKPEQLAALKAAIDQAQAQGQGQGGQGVEAMKAQLDQVTAELKQLREAPRPPVSLPGGGGGEPAAKGNNIFAGSVFDLTSLTASQQ